MNTLDDLFGLWETVKALADDINVNFNTVHTWKFRQSIPANRWDVIVNAAKKRGYKGVTFKKLSQIAVRRKTREKKINGNAA